MIQSRVCRISLHCQALSIQGPDVKPGRMEPSLSARNLTRLGINSVIGSLFLGINSIILLNAEHSPDSCSCPALGCAVGPLYTSYFLATTITFPVQLAPGAPYLVVPAGQTCCTQFSLQRLELLTSLFYQILLQKDYVVLKACSLSCWEVSQKCSAG